MPYYKFIFAKFTNEPSKDVKNEKIKSIELGYGYNRNNTFARINAYYTYWEDKSILANEYDRILDPVMLRGLDALHKGIEIDISHRITKDINLGAIASFGDWKWKNNVSAEVYNKNNVLDTIVKSYADGLNVGDAPQTQLGVYGSIHFLKQFDFSAKWVYYDKLFADFDPVKRNDPADKSQSYQMPAYCLLDLHLGFAFKIGKLPAYANIGCYNVLNKEYIARGMDGQNHDRNSFNGFWGFGRTFNFGLSVNIF